MELYKQNWKEVEDSIKLKYGETVFQSKNDLMRPMNSKELKEFANHDEVSLANHTNNHQNLENYSIQDLESFILEGHDYLKNELDIESKSLAYPYGFYNKNTILATKKLNYKLGYTINEGKNYLYNYNPFEIKRFSLNGYEYMPDICHRALISNS